MPPSNWDRDDESSEEEVPETVKEHKRQFTEWRKKHYNEFHAVKRAKELMKQVMISIVISTPQFYLCEYYRMKRNCWLWIDWRRPACKIQLQWKMMMNFTILWKDKTNGL